MHIKHRPINHTHPNFCGCNLICVNQPCACGMQKARKTKLFCVNRGKTTKQRK